MLTVAVLAKLAGGDDLVSIAAWARLRASELNARFRQQRTSMPHPTTWGRILGQAVDPAALTQAVAEILLPPAADVPARGSLLLVLDGKTLRGTIPVCCPRGVHLLVAYLPATGVVLLHVEVDRKENEIVAAPRLLRQLDLTGMVVTGDAMHTQRAVSIQIMVFFLFSQTSYTLCNLFVKKDGLFRPAGGDINFRWSDRVTPVIE